MSNDTAAPNTADTAKLTPGQRLDNGLNRFSRFFDRVVDSTAEIIDGIADLAGEVKDDAKVHLELTITGFETNVRFDPEQLRSLIGTARPGNPDRSLSVTSLKTGARHLFVITGEINPDGKPSAKTNIFTARWVGHDKPFVDEKFRLPVTITRSDKTILVKPGWPKK